MVRDASGTLVQDSYQDANATQAGGWQQLQVGLRLAQGGTVALSVETDGAAGPDVYFDDVRVDQTGSTIVQEQHNYAYGAPMAGLNYVIGTKKYRHGYQGQYAEKDEETGWDDFELRMYDLRIGRWTAPDPMGQFHSPYVGMGNNPVSNVDADGSIAEWLGSFLSNIGIGNFVKSVGVTGTYYAPSLAQIGSVGLNVGLGAAITAVRTPSWASKWDSLVHQEANYVAVYGQEAMLRGPDTNSKNAIIYRALNDATEEADRGSHQTDDYSYMHAMSSPDQTRVQARDLSNKFIRKQYNKAHHLLIEGKTHDAYFQFGLALHTLQDATSPRHNGFQVNPKPYELIYHALTEMDYPGVKSNLQNVTNTYFKLFSSGQPLPNRNLFSTIKADN